MAVMGPEYNSEKADKVAQELWQKLLKDNKLLSMPDNWFGVELGTREKLKEDFRFLVHEVFKIDSWESF